MDKAANAGLANALSGTLALPLRRGGHRQAKKAGRIWPKIIIHDDFRL